MYRQTDIWLSEYTSVSKYANCIAIAEWCHFIVETCFLHLAELDPLNPAAPPRSPPNEGAEINRINGRKYPAPRCGHWRMKSKLQNLFYGIIFISCAECMLVQTYGTGLTRNYGAWVCHEQLQIAGNCTPAEPRRFASITAGCHKHMYIDVWGLAEKSPNVALIFSCWDWC